MGKASSAKKVARAARAGNSTSNTKERRELGFPLTIAAVLLIGIAGIVLARNARDVSNTEPTLRDHWHSAYAVWDCTDEQFLPPFQSSFDPRGIHSHQDGLIHIHPFSSAVTGDGATLEVFLDAMLVRLTDDEFELENGETLSEDGATCNGEPAVLQVVRWNGADVASGPTEVVLEDLDQVSFDADLEAFTIALAPEGAEIPAPPSVDGALQAPSDLQSEGPVTTITGSDDGTDSEPTDDDGSSTDSTDDGTDDDPTETPEEPASE